MKKIAKGIAFIIVGLCLMSCSDSTDTDDGIIDVVVLQSDGNNYPEFWEHLNLNWSQFGSNEIVIDYTTLDYPDITFFS